MKVFNKALAPILLFIGVFAINTQAYSQANERVLGSISGEMEAGEQYDKYRRSSDTMREYMRGWTFVKEVDNMKDYSYDELYGKCLEEAKRQYKGYSNLSLMKLSYKIRFDHLDDVIWSANIMGSSTEYKKKGLTKKIYEYSATVVVNE